VTVSFIDDHRDVYGVEPIGNIPPAEAGQRWWDEQEQAASAA
jgi:hypothetical protein